jgi:hypothetical protein
MGWEPKRKVRERALKRTERRCYDVELKETEAPEAKERLTSKLPCFCED